MPITNDELRSKKVVLAIIKLSRGIGPLASHNGPTANAEGVKGGDRPPPLPQSL